MSKTKKSVQSQNEFYFIIYGAVLSIKCLLIRCYHSTDFEVYLN